MEIMSLVNLNPTTKQEAESFIERLTTAVAEGEINPLELHIKLNAMEKAIEGVRKNVRDAVMNEANKYPEKIFDVFSAKIEKTEVGTKYDYSNCGDVQWLEAKDQESEWKRKREERELFLKSLKKPMSINDETTGEVIEVRPPAKTSSSFIKVTLK